MADRLMAQPVCSQLRKRPVRSDTCASCQNRSSPPVDLVALSIRQACSPQDIVLRTEPYLSLRHGMASIQSGMTGVRSDAVFDGGPIAPSDRIAAIDIVRGIALFGVMAINVVTVFRVSIFEQFLPVRIDGTWLDRAVHAILLIGIDMKAWTLFSLLFGVGLAIQYDHLSTSTHRTVLLVRRLAFLMVIGAIHLVLVWNGDILFGYAIAGFIVLPFLFGPPRVPAVAGTILMVWFIASSFLPPIATMPSRAWMTQNVADAVRNYGSGGLPEVLAFRIHELSGFLPLNLFMFPRTIALMLIGVTAWRSGLFRAGTRTSRYLPLVAAVGILGGGALAVAHVNGWTRLGMESRAVARTLECGPDGVRLWCSYHLGNRQAEGSKAVGVGRTDWANGVHKLPNAILDLRLGLLRVWARPVRKARRCGRSGHRYQRLHPANCL